MKYINKTLTIEKINLQKIANKFGTPFYSYSYSKLKENINNFKKNFRSFSPLICFAVKSNTNVNIIKEIKKFGLGADVVSVGELMMALKAGINPSKIVFSCMVRTLFTTRPSSHHCFQSVRTFKIGVELEKVA